MHFSTFSEVMEVKADLPGQQIDWGIQLVQAPKLWSVTKGEGMKIGILDTGIDYTHPDLSSNFVKGRNFTTDDVSDYVDKDGHGTHCAGIIAGCDNDIGIIGVAPKASLYMGKVISDDGKGSIQNVIEGIRWAINQKVDILSMSIGVAKEPTEELHEVISDARKAGIILVAATGNENTNVCYPAAYPEVISVGAISQDLQRAGFSNYGEKLDVMAPGVDIYSTYPINSYAKLSGTSMATPIVAGVIALLQSYCRKNGILATPDVIKEMISSHSIDLGEKGKDNMFGSGLINVSELLKQTI